jgi:hypothetical protein
VSDRDLGCGKGGHALIEAPRRDACATYLIAPMYGWRRRRWTQIARPDRSVVKLDDHAIAPLN